jgi:hypothetical protein
VRKLLAIVAVLVLSATAAAEVLDSRQTVVSPGQLDLPVQQGSFIPDNCPFGPNGPVLPAPICIAFPMGEGALDVQAAYATALQESGWRFASGAANVFFFERPVNRTDCSQRLMMIGWLLGDETEIAKYGTEEETTMDWSLVEYGTFIFLLSEDVCGADRQLQ